MLPDVRRDEYLYPIPKFTIESKDVNSFTDELQAFHGEFADCFQRSETRENVLSYMIGQFSELERKSIEPIALNVENATVRSMQRAISDAVWDDEKISIKYRSLVVEDMGDPNGAIIFDESGFQKKGGDSAGVARQYCGNLGKVENFQVGVFSAYASPQGYAFLDKRLFFPQKWFSDEYREKREKCGVPEELPFKTKPQLAAEMLREIHEQNIVPYRYVLADCLYGESPEFLEAVESLIGKTYFVAVAFNTLCWLKSPLQQIKKYKHKGEVLTKKVLKKGSKKPITVEDFARNLHETFWYRRIVSEGTKGPIEYEFTKRRITLSKNGLPWKNVWLVVKRTIEETPIHSYYISNASSSVRLKTFVWLSGVRWAIEQGFEETKTELGMDQYEVRKYRGWNHHILISMLTHFFLWHLKLRLGKKSTIHYFIPA